MQFSALNYDHLITFQT